MVVGGRATRRRRPEQPRHDRERDPHPRRPAGAARAAQSNDVIHSFWVPEPARQDGPHPRPRRHDAGSRPTRPGVYRGQCAEFCGLQHAQMALLRHRRAAGRSSRPGCEAQRGTARAARRRRQRRAGQQVFLGRHLRDVPRDPRHAGRRRASGPTSRTSRAGRRSPPGTLPNTRGNLAGWIARPAAASSRATNMPPIAAVRRRPAGAARLPGEPEVSADRRREADAAPRRGRRLPRAGARAARRAPGRRRRGFVGWLCDGRPQDDRPALHRHRVRLLRCSAALLALLMRLQLARPENTLLGPDLYNQLFTMHGTTMMFLFAVPVMEAFGDLPRAADDRHAQHRLPAAERLRLLDLPVRRAAPVRRPSCSNIGPDAGWFAYVPLAGPAVLARQARRRLGAADHLHRDVGAGRGGRTSSSRSSSMRAPGMTLNRMPLFVWAMLVDVVHDHLRDARGDAGAAPMLIMDRLVGTHFFNPAEGGDALLWQHLFWFFGHPEVYIIFIPALGMVSTIIADLRAAPDLRLPGDGAVADRDRLPRLRAVGAPHVRDRPARSSARASSPRRA